jgi:homoserine kinase type II
MRVIRAWPLDGPSPEDLARIHGWVTRAGALSFIPVPLPALDGRQFQESAGRLWELAPWLEGTRDSGRPPLLAHIRAGFAGLGAFHQILAEDHTENPSPGLRRRLEELDRLCAGGFDSLREVLHRSQPGPVRSLAERWLALARRLAAPIRAELRRSAPREVFCQPCLRDARAEHLLFQAGRLTGLVDFGAMGVDNIAADLARLLSEWIGSDRRSRSEALSAYAAVRPLAEVELGLLPIFERSAALLGPGHWVRWHFIEQRTFDEPGTVQRGLERGLERLKELSDSAIMP